MEYFAVYAQDYHIYKEPFTSKDDADKFLNYGVVHGLLFAIGIVHDGKVIDCGSKGIYGPFTEAEVMKDFERATLYSHYNYR